MASYFGLAFTCIGRRSSIRIVLIIALRLALGRFIFKPLELFLLLPVLGPLSFGFLKIVVRLSHLHLGVRIERRSRLLRLARSGALGRRRLESRFFPLGGFLR